MRSNHNRAQTKRAHKRWLASQARRDCIYRQCQNQGKHLGQDEWGEVWLLDAKVWLIDAREAILWGDYFEFCHLVRNGARPTFTPIKGGHLSS